MSIPPKIRSSIEAVLCEVDAWAERELDRKVDISWLVLGLEYSFLEKLEKRGAKNFAETYTTLVLAVLFKKLFGEHHVSAIADTIMVMNFHKGDRESCRLRVKALVKNHADKIATAAAR